MVEVMLVFTKKQRFQKIFHNFREELHWIRPKTYE